MNYSVNHNIKIANNSTDCLPLTSLGDSDFALAITVIVVASLAVGFLLFILYLTLREARTVKYNIRRLSEIERESFSMRRTSQGGLLEPPNPGEERRPTMEDLYDSILPQYADALQDHSGTLNDSDSSSQETVAVQKWGGSSSHLSGLPWLMDFDPEQHLSDNTDTVLRKLIFPGEFSDEEEGQRTVNGSSPRRTTSSVKDRVKRSFHQMRHSLHSTSSLADVDSKSSLAIFNENSNSNSTTQQSNTLSDQHHRSVSSFSELGNRNSRRNGSVPTQLYRHNNISNISNIHNNINNNVERKTTTGILRRNSSRLQTDLDHRMRQRRVAVSFNSKQTQLKEFSPNDLVKKTIEEPGSTEI